MLYETGCVNEPIVSDHGFGICHTKSGYLFRSEGGRVLYFTGSTVLGIAFGAVLGIVTMFVVKFGQVRTS